MNLSQYLPLFLITLFASLGDPTRTNNSQPIPVPERGENVCAFPKKKIQFVLRRNATTTTKVKIVECGIPSFPDLECREEMQLRENAGERDNEPFRRKAPSTYLLGRNGKPVLVLRTGYTEKESCPFKSGQRQINTSTIHWYPFRKAVSYNIYDCCPGWTGYVPRVGCKKRAPCHVAIPQNVPAHCRGKRSKDLQKQRALYKLGHMQNLPFPMSDINPSLLINLTLSDPFSGPWMKLYGYMLNLNLHLIENYPKSHKKEFSKISDYEKVYHFFMKQQQNNARLHPFFRFPSQEELFKDVVNNVTWRDDRVFAEQRLAGLNPMALMKVTVDQGSIGVGWSELQQRLNPNYDWNRAVGNSMAKKIKLEDAIKEGSVFVAQFPLFDNLSTVPDITEPRPTRKMWPSMSPIALFASRPGHKGAPAQLRPVAIQLDYTPGSQVYSPDDGDLWLLAKESFQVTDFAYVEMVEHLLRTHLLMEPFCVCFLRHVSKLHPLHQLMKFHCRGLIPTNKIGFPKLVGDKAYMHQLFAIGNTGAVSLLVRAYMTLTWADTDFKAKNKARGVNDRSKLPYFPYRDDGEVIYEAMADLVNDYINFYYAADQDVLQDHEIQALANEISSQGLGSNGGKGKLRGFPRTIETKSELKDIITRLIWTSTAQHTAVNYPIAVYGAYTPNMPTKIYDDDRVPFDVFNPYRLPNGVVSAVQAGVAMSLGSLRLDRLFDYGTQMSDRAGGAIVNSHYKRLHSEVKPLLNKRNSQRFQEGYLTYPYLSPAWIPNSICT